MDWTTLLGNALMLQRIAVPVFGSNGPLWSLSCEWWHYSIFLSVRYMEACKAGAGIFHHKEPVPVANGLPPSRTNYRLPQACGKIPPARFAAHSFEWYGFYLYGSLAPIIAKQFFAGTDPTTGFIFALLAFAAGFIVRPFGALVFGRLGDMIGRKYTFLITILSKTKAAENNPAAFLFVCSYTISSLRR